MVLERSARERPAGIAATKDHPPLALAEPSTVAMAWVLRPVSPLEDTGSYSGALGNAIAWLLLACALLTTADQHRAPVRSRRTTR